MKLLLIIIFFFMVEMINNMVTFGYGINDSFWRVIWAIDEGTTWAKGFKEENFERVNVGMSKEEVFNLLGKPLHDVDDCDELCTWAYTRQDSPTSDFDQRWIRFDRNGFVSEKIKSFYID